MMFVNGIIGHRSLRFVFVAWSVFDCRFGNRGDVERGRDVELE